MGKNKGQGSVEFVILLSVMMLVFLLFFVVIQNRLIEAQHKENERIAEEVADIVFNEVRLAKSVSEGFTRVFELPTRINGFDYNIELLDDTDLVIVF